MLTAWFRADAGGETATLLGKRCAECGYVVFPPLPMQCARCWSPQLEEVELNGPARLHTYTVIHRSFPGFPDRYAVGLLDLPDGPRVMARLVADDLGRLEVGMEMRSVTCQIRVDGDGNPVAGFGFRATGEPVADNSRGEVRRG